MKEGDRVYSILRKEILQGELTPGVVLAEVDLSNRLGVSRTPVREALRRLDRDKLVQIRPGRGAIVPEISMDSVAQLFQMREALETYAARLSARKGDPDVFGPLLRELTAAAKKISPTQVPADAYDAYTQVVSRLDAAVQDAAGNVYLNDALNNVTAHVSRLRRLARRNPARMAAAAKEHVAICQAILDRDGNRAAELTAAHIHSSLQSIVAVYIEDVTGSALVGPSAVSGLASAK